MASPDAAFKSPARAGTVTAPASASRAATLAMLSICFMFLCCLSFCFCRYGTGSVGLLLLFDYHLQSSIFHRLHEDLVVAFALIRVGDGEVRDVLVEFVALTEIPADLSRLTAAGVRTGEGPSA